MTDNLALWKSVEKTDPAHTKPFRGKGGFGGTAISPMYLIRKATELWGPMGHKWGITIIKDQVAFAGTESVHIVQAEVWYTAESGGRCAVPCFGQTQFSGTRKDGTPFVDEEAPKKSLTDALTKGLSWLGFAADVHMGKYDDVKYINQIKGEFDEERRTVDSAETRERALSILGAAAKGGRQAFTEAWKVVSSDMRKSLTNDDIANLKKITEAADARSS